jgi:signal peptidase I
MNLITSLPLNNPVGITLGVNLETFFFVLLLLTTVCFCIRKISLIRAHKTKKEATLPFIITSCAELFGVILIAWLIRGFLAQGYYVPTGSLEPTVLPGDVLFVQQYAYGLNLPLFHYQLYPGAAPKRGDIALFYWPKDTKWIYIKRVIGVPGDHIVYQHKKLTINGKKIKYHNIGPTLSLETDIPDQPVMKQQEWLTKKLAHLIYIKPYVKALNTFDITVPKGHYFMMGDNRDESSDSRYWGFVPRNNFIGKATKIIISVNWRHYSLRQHRYFKVLH